MKAITLLTTSCLMVACSFFSLQLQGQTNLVPNGSFEQYTNCPNVFNRSYTPTFWRIVSRIGDAGYFNACDTTNWSGVPIHRLFGIVNFQNARTGNAFIDLVMLSDLGYFQTKLKDSLKPNHYYYGAFYANSPKVIGAGCDGVAMLLTDTAFYADTTKYETRPFVSSPQIINYGNPIVYDTLGWVKIAAVFKAKGGEQYATLGNFQQFGKTKYAFYNLTGYGAANHNIDDVSLYDLDSFHVKADAGRDTTIAKGDSVFIGSYTNGIDTIKWLQNGNTVIDTARPGFWIWPTTNTFYVLTQTVGGFTSSDTVFINVSTLPVKFISFSATLKENKVENSWQTANEINVNSYLIEKSSDGKAFYWIGKLVAENKTKNSYAFTDENASEGVSYYMVLALDNDGRKTYSGVQRVENNKAQKPLFIYPNPANDLITIKAQSLKAVTIINTEGKVVYSEKVNNNSTTINVSSLPKGVYLVKGVLENNTVVSEKLIKE